MPKNKYQEALKYFTGFVSDNLYHIFDKESKEFHIVSKQALEELVDRATPKKIIETKNAPFGECPNCKGLHTFNLVTGETLNYCPECGQAIDWSNDEPDKPC